MTWHTHAQCVGDDPHKYVLDEGPWKLPTTTHRRARATELCAGCPVMAECASDALEHNDMGVVRGGVWIPAHTSLQPRKAREALTDVAMTPQQPLRRTA